MIAIDPALRNHVTTTFAPLNRVAAANSFPPIATLSDTLSKDLPKREPGGRVINVPPRVAALFTTAAVEMWQRAVHSFMISSALTNISPIWACVSGYYSSHYSIRAAAHLLGYFQLFRRKRIVRLQTASGRYICTFESKQGSHREHSFYWKTVKADSYFAADPFFTVNDSCNDASDIAHRDRASYVDHLLEFPNFKPLNLDELQTRIDYISRIEFDTPPIPRVSKCPDVESTQVIAYYRLIAFRRLVDEILGGSNRFWNVQRDPSWASKVLNFQLTSAASVNGLGGA